MKLYFKGIQLPFARLEYGAKRYAEKVIEYIGVDGFAKMNLGSRGRSFRVTGFVSDALFGNPTWGTLDAMHDFQAGTFTIDCQEGGTANYTNVIVDEPPTFSDFKDMFWGGANRLTCKYAMVFRQMVPNAGE
jgi:hypothetical protein